MPELPEVETTCRGLKPAMLNKQITHVQVRQPKLRYPIPDDFSRQIEGCTVSAIRRRSKYILLDFNNGLTAIVHLGMSGRMVIDENTPPAKHDHVLFALEGGHEVRFNDPRRFGLMLLTPTNEIAQHKLIAALGPEPLEQNFNADYLYNALKKRKSAIKPTLMDSKLVVGVGNIYANESLFYSRINPATPANKTTRKQAHTLCANIKTVLKKAIVAGGSSLRDYKQTDGKLGYFQYDFAVYGREGKPCRTCTTPIRKITLGQRSTFFCPTCQK